MAKYSFTGELCLAHAAEHERRLYRYMQNLRAACRRSGGYERYKRDSRKYMARHWRMYEKNKGRVLHHIICEHWPAGLIYTVVNGKITGVRDSERGE